MTRLTSAVAATVRMVGLGATSHLLYLWQLNKGHVVVLSLLHVQCSTPINRTQSSILVSLCHAVFSWRFTIISVNLTLLLGRKEFLTKYDTPSLSSI